MKRIAIIGAGPAGVSAALYAKRANVEVDVYDKNSSALAKGHLIENYYGFASINGEELYRKGLQQLERLGIPLFLEEVVGVEVEDACYRLSSGIRQKSYDVIILATGSYRSAPPLKGIREMEGKGVSYCAMCDGFFYRGKKVGVIGNGEYALHEAEYLQQIAAEVLLFTNGRDFKGGNKVKVIPAKLAGVIGEDKVRGLLSVESEEYPLDGIFIAEGSAGSVDFARKLGIFVHNNKIETDDKMATNVPGIYACGDCVTGMQQIAKAVYEGALAAGSAIDFLRKKS